MEVELPVMSLMDASKGFTGVTRLINGDVAWRFKDGILITWLSEKEVATQLRVINSTLGKLIWRHQ